MEQQMFCFQCEETAQGQGCIYKGVCGKSADVACVQDELIYLVKELSYITTQQRRNGIHVNSSIDELIEDCLFATITNANFDKQALENLKKRLLISYQQLTKTALVMRDEKIGVCATANSDIRSLKELITYGLKGLAAYIKHARVLNYTDNDIDAFIQNTLAELLRDDLSADELVSLALRTGEYGVKGMALLDRANTLTYGNPEITTVDLSVGNRPGILISGHDLKDLELLLEQSEGKGVDIYTHSEMLPAHYYPKFKKYHHFAGNYGNAWYKQQDEFESFNGPILMTTNCIVPPRDSYKDRLYTTGIAGYPGCKHIGDKKDFSEIITQALTCPAPNQLEEGYIVGGFAHKQVDALTDKIIQAVKNGDIRKFVVMGGCDGRKKQRNYYTELAKKLPKDVIILTAGCAKYKYNKLNLGDINGIPRVLDAGQCNDSYSLVLIARKLQEVLQLDDINDLPIVYNISWYEQKAIIVLLSLLYLGIKNIHLGPTLPAFISENVLSVLQKKFHLQSIQTVDEDLKLFL